jgi:PPM family protein phosphatase
MFAIYRGQRYLHTGTTTVTLSLQDSMLALEFAQISDTGPVRPGNEDYIGYVAPETPEQAGTRGWLFALADGVGGHEKGEVASRTAIESLLAGFRAARAGESHTTLLHRLVQAANASVFQAALASGVSGAGMATTLVACALRYDRAVVAHVGDSRCYLIRRNELTALTRDHTVAQEHVKLGLLSQDEVAEAETRHVLSRSVGIGLFANVEINDHQILPGDVLLLCSDGLHGAVTSLEITQVVGQEADLHAAAQKLVALANERDGGDNVSVQLICVQSVERVGMYRGRPYKLR